MVYSFEAQIILVIGLCIIFSYALNLVIRRIKLPLMIAPLFAGLIINYYSVGISYHLPFYREIIEIFSGIGIILILFFIGLKVDLHFLKGMSKNSSIIALNAGLVPFVLGFAFTFYVTKDWTESLFVGIALAITAEEVSIEILEELSLIQKRIGQIIIEAGIIGDIFEISAIALLGLLLRSSALSSGSVFNFVFELIGFILVILMMRYFILDWLLTIVGKDKKRFEYSTIAIVTLFIMVSAAELLNISSILGALIAGLLLKNKLIADKLYVEEHHIVEALEVFNFGVFHSIIFIWIGITINLSSIMSNIAFGIMLTIIAIAGKLLGSIIGNTLIKEPMEEGILIGWGLNARGATEMFALLVAKNTGFLSTEIFSSVVFMVLITTIISPIIFKYLVSKGYGLIEHNASNSKHHK
ncbi:MAG: cation:proton antiporter [archaeon]